MGIVSNSAQLARSCEDIYTTSGIALVAKGPMPSSILKDPNWSYAIPIGVGAPIGFSFGYLVKATLVSVYACPIGADDWFVILLIVCVLTIGAMVLLPFLTFATLSHSAPFANLISRRFARRSWLLGLTTVVIPAVIGSLFYIDSCRQLTYAPLQGVAAIKIENSNQGARAILRDPTKITTIAAFINGRSHGWVTPVPGFATLVRLTFLSASERELGTIQFGEGGMVRISKDGSSVYKHDNKSDAAARYLCNALGQPVALQMCGGAGMFGNAMQYSVNQKLVDRCRQGTRSTKPALDACARLVFGPGRFERPIITVWRQFNNSEKDAYYAKFPGFTVENFCGSIRRAADGSLALTQERNLKRCTSFNVDMYWPLGPDDAVPAIWRGGPFRISPDASNWSHSTIEIPPGDDIPVT